MGGGSSKKNIQPVPIVQQPIPAKIEQEPKAVIDIPPLKIDEDIQEYVRPVSPELTKKKIKGVDIVEDDQIDKNANNKKLLEEQKSKENQENKQNQNDKDKDNSFERGLDKLELKDNDISELERKMQEDDISPINRTLTEEQKKKKDDDKIALAAIQMSKKFSKVPVEFKWENEGTVRLISVTFKYVFSHKFKQISLVKPYNAYVNSILSWIKDEQNLVFIFTLKDVEVYDLQSGDIVNLDHNEVQFMVNYSGNFVGIRRESDFIKKLKNGIIQNQENQLKKEEERRDLLENKLSHVDKMANQRLHKQPKPQQQKFDVEKIIKQTEKSLKSFWQETVQSWVGANRVENEHLVIGNTFHQGIKCLLTNKTDTEPKQKIETFLRQKLEQPEFFKACFQSTRTIKDKLKKWQAFSAEEELTYLNDERYLKRVERDNIFFQKKYDFPILEKYQMTSGIVDEVTLKPQVITMDTCKRIVIENDRDLFVDIEHEAKLMVFIWQSQLANKLQNENIFVEELGKFRDHCDLQLKQVIFDLSMIPTFPMEHRPKFKERYFQI